MTKGAQHWLTLDIMDYLMENPYKIGTNFVTEFPNSYVKEFEDYSEIVLLTEDNEEAGTILLKLNPEWEEKTRIERRMTMEDFEVCIDNTRYTISDIMKWAKELKVSYKELLEKLECWKNYHWAVFAYMDCNPDWIEDISQLDFSNEYIHLGDFCLLVVDEYDADKIHYEKCSDLVDDEIPEYLSSYFDYDSFAANQNRAEMLAGWDGIEHAYYVNDEWIYVYRN